MTFTVKWGERIKKWGGWYRHDDIYQDGVKLEGCVQVRTNGRGGLESITIFRGACVMGTDVNWLAKQNALAKTNPELWVKEK